MWTPSRKEVDCDVCGTCESEVEPDQHGLQCDFCETWEHVKCIRRPDTIPDSLYTALVESRSKALLFCCTTCRRKGSVVKQLYKLKSDLAVADEQRLASARAIQEARDSVRDLKADKERLQAEVDVLHVLLGKTRKHKAGQITAGVAELQLVSAENASTKSETEVKPKATPTNKHADLPAVVLEESSGSSSSEEEEEVERHTPGCSTHPKGFKELRFRVDKFSGNTREADFEVWLEDFMEATGDCGWSDADRAKWFSWFLTGPAKSTWQRTLKSKQKGSWKQIVSVYRGQYGVHMDPRTAYQRCHELRYEQFKSVQGLVDAMRDYQRMAPQKLTDAALESILWNKVPLELQKEVKEITDGSIQELLQKLLRAESVVEERERRTATEPRRKKDHGSSNQEILQQKPIPPIKSTSSKGNSKPELDLQAVKCYRCSEFGHLARDCQKRKKRGMNRIVVSEEDGEILDPWCCTLKERDPLWMRTLTAPKACGMRGPSYKVDVFVDKVKVRALLDHGAQVSLVRGELLPKIQEKNNWTLEECHVRNCDIEGQPTGASGQTLGATSAVMLQVANDDNSQPQQIPCYVLPSCKPIWSGEMNDCAMVLGTNALEDLGFYIVDRSGAKVKSDGEPPSEQVQEKSVNSVPTDGNDQSNCSPPMVQSQASTTQPVVTEMTSDSVVVRRLILCQKCRIGPQQTCSVKVKASNDEPTESVGIITSNESVLAAHQCDILDGFWTGDCECYVPLTNWGTRPVQLEKGSVVGNIEEVDLIASDDRVWDEDPCPTVATITPTEVRQREGTLLSQLNIGDAGTLEEQKCLKKFLCSTNEVFALSDHELGETDLVEHSINLEPGSRPFRTTPRRLPYALRTELEAELMQLLESGCIEPSTSPYASGLVLVRKKDGGLRVCVDYRGINKDTIPDCYPIPRIDDLIDMVGRCKGKFFTTLDLMKGYHQIRMEEESRTKTAFTCHLGLYQYRRMPFGLTNAPATFQRLMNQLFSGEQWKFVFVYLDDLLIVSQSATEHQEHVRKVLAQLHKAGLKLKPSKCKFAHTKVDYLGHTLTAEGVVPNDQKILAVKEFPQPTCSKEVRSFLGLVNFYRRHVPNLAVIARPLTALTRKDKTTGQIVPFVWDTDCDLAFNKIKELLVSAPMLHPPDLSMPFYLWTDASAKGFGALLEQCADDGKRYPIAYASRQTNAAEAKYAPTELEIAALVYAVEHFEVYLLGSQTTVYTDHQALVTAFLSHMKNQTKGLLARWYLRISRFLPLLKLEYKPGSANVVADALSRAPVMRVGTAQPALQLVMEEQRQDGELERLIKYLDDDLLPSDPSEAKKVVNQSQKGYYLMDGVLYYEGPDMPDRRRLVVPSHLRDRVIDEHHDSVFAGHFAAKRTAQRISQYFYWRGLKSQVYKKCESCVTCASVKGQGHRGRPPLVSIPVGDAFECIGMDFIELEWSKAGNKYALVLQDYLTKWPEVYAVPNRKAETVAKCLLDVVWKHGVPLRIIHDRAAEFLSEVVQEVATLLGVSQLPTSGGHPQTDGLVERFNRTLKQMLSKLVGKGGRDWDQLLGPVLFAYRTTPHSSTGMSPFYLMYGRDPKLPSSLDFQAPAVKFPIIETEYGKELERELKQARQLARQHIQSAQRSQKKFYDRSSKEIELKVGDRVMLKVEPQFKLDRTFKGPFLIKSLSPTNAMIQLQCDSSADVLNVSRQRLSLCGPAMAGVTPWVGHSGRLRKRRGINRNRMSKCDEDHDTTDQLQSQVPTITTRSGREVRRPSRFNMMNIPEVCSSKRGEVVRTQQLEEGSRGESVESRVEHVVGTD